MLTVASLVPRTALEKPIDLDRYPVGEASAAIEVPCVDDPQASCIWVGDNEQEDNVFEYAADANGKLTPTKHFDITPGNAEVGDIEALVPDEQGLLVIGSHSRKRDCTQDTKHDRVAVARVLRDPLCAEFVASGQGWEDHLTGCDSTWVTLEDAQSGSLTGVEFVKTDALPPSAEGLVIQSAAKRAIVLVDGDKGEVKGHCAMPTQELTVTLP